MVLWQALRRQFRSTADHRITDYTEQPKEKRNTLAFPFLRRPEIYRNLCIKDSVKIDPCMGSDHILVYAFDVLMEIYKENSYAERDAAAMIVQNNLFGLDIDGCTSQLVYFAVMMKARSYDRHFLNCGIKPNVLAIIIKSKTAHDFRFCRCGSCAVDGGHDYLRRCGNREDWEELSEAEKVEDNCALT